jgi:hypothetical protein
MKIYIGAGHSVDLHQVRPLIYWTLDLLHPQFYPFAAMNPHVPPYNQFPFNRNRQSS